MNNTKEKAIEIYALVANDSYVCTVSSPDRNNCETSVGTGSDMIGAIESDEYNEYYLEKADKTEAVDAYNNMVDTHQINGEGFANYDYHQLTVVSESMMEVAYIPVGGW